MPERERSWIFSRPAMVLLGLLAGVVLLEVGARVTLPLLAEGDLAAHAGTRVPDPVLEYRIEPGTGGHDGRGFRNAQTLDRADVVALGDSQTWGVNASIGGSWPAQLAARTGRTVYNMGRGGYALLQYRALLDDALALEPRWIVVAFYFGNDVWDAYDLAYKLDSHAPKRHPDPAERARIRSSAYPNLQQMFFERLRYHQTRGGIAGWLRSHTAVGRIDRRQGPRGTAREPEYCASADFQGHR